ncbi:MAG: hypothetical protein ATN34_05175 [Epulopiscium sp. Nele67-Bin002]|nr:MAG: hypothetical protein ATN34_05175 [Epulopiscium sp. Nele67-Bin002]
MERTDLYDEYCIDYNQNFYTYTKAELDAMKSKLTADELKHMEQMVDEIFTYPQQSVTFDRPDFVSHLNKHQYFSLSSYFYPVEGDASQAWVRRDGEVNPESIAYAKRGLRKTSMVISLASMMYYFTGQEKYSQLLEKHIRSFFLDPQTRMLPNLNHAQMIINHPVHKDGRGGGIIDFASNMGYGFVMLKHLYDAGMLAEDIYEPLKEWTNELLQWLSVSPVAAKEQASLNNHGTIYTLMVAQLHFFVGDLDAHKKALLLEINLRLAQINPDGSMPRELGRTRGLAYSTMNLKSYIDTYKILGEDFARKPQLRQAFEFLLPVLKNDISITDLKYSHNGLLKSSEQMDGTYPEYYKLYLKHVGKDFDIDLNVISDADVHYRYLFV